MKKRYVLIALLIDAVTAGRRSNKKNKIPILFARTVLQLTQHRDLLLNQEYFEFCYL